MTTIHKPVLLQESIKYLNVRKGDYIDCTLGGGGHTLAIADELMKIGGGTIFSFDMDGEAIVRFEKRIMQSGWAKQSERYHKGNVRIQLIKKNFAHLRDIASDVQNVLGIIADLGLSSDQLESSERGFSYTKDGPLDMRMDSSLTVSAEDLVNGLYKSELEQLFKQSEEPFSKQIAKAIVDERKRKRLTTTQHLINIIQKALPFKARQDRSSRKPSDQSFRSKRDFWIKPAMRVFQSLRIAVNSELSSLQSMLPQAIEALAAGGRLVIISFHSGEDRVVKQFFRDVQGDGNAKIITKKPVEPGADEYRENIRSRSAKMRVLEKI